MKAVCAVVVTLLYISIGLVLFVPHLMDKRSHDCDISPSLFDSGNVSRNIVGTHCKTHSWKEKSQDSILNIEFKSSISSLNFDVNSFYSPKMTSPKSISEPLSRWLNGPESFLEYLTLQYLPLQRRKVQTGSDTIIYQKKGKIGIATQLLGVCDILLIGIINERPVQINAPGIPGHFFDFPLYNFTFPATIPVESELYRYSKTVDVSNSTVTTILVLPKSSIPGITSDRLFNDEYKGITVMNSYISMIIPITKHRSFNTFINGFNPSINQTLTIRTWYPQCLRSVFQPSSFLLSYLNPYLNAFSGRFLIGLHIRMAGNHSVWKETSIGMTIDGVLSYNSTLQRLFTEHTDSQIFLSTDSREIEKTLHKTYPNKVKTVADLPRMHTGQLTTEAGLMRAYLEIFILSKCDFLLLTKRSSFSRVARLMNAKSPELTGFVDEVGMTMNNRLYRSRSYGSFICGVLLMVVISIGIQSYLSTSFHKFPSFIRFIHSIVLVQDTSSRPVSKRLFQFIKPTIGGVINPTNNSFQKSTFIKQIDSYSIIHDSICHPTEMDFSNSSWRLDFEHRQQCLFSSYKEHVPNGSKGPYKETNSSFTSAHIYNNDGVHWAYLTNTCMNMKYLSLSIYLDEHKYNPFSDRLEGYQHNWQFKRVVGSFPKESNSHVYYRDSGAWMIIPGWIGHTSHFTENAITVNHRASNPGSFPPMRNIFLPRFVRKTEIKFTKGLLDVLSNTHPRTGPNSINFHVYEDIKNIVGTAQFICFKQLGISGHMNHEGRGGYFPYPYEGDILRAAAYRHFGIQVEGKYIRSSIKLNILYMPRDKRSKGRQLINVSEVEDLIKSMNASFNYQSVLIHTVPISEQIHYTVDADILLSVHGAAVATLVFLLPRSTYIELRPPNFRDNWYNLVCNQGKLQHVAMNNFSVPLPESCPSIKATLDPVKFQKCWSSVHFADFYVCIECLRSVLLEQYVTVNLMKYGSYVLCVC